MQSGTSPAPAHLARCPGCDPGPTGPTSPYNRNQLISVSACPKLSSVRIAKSVNSWRYPYTPPRCARRGVKQPPRKSTGIEI